MISLYCTDPHRSRWHAVCASMHNHPRHNRKQERQALSRYHAVPNRADFIDEVIAWCSMAQRLSSAPRDATIDCPTAKALCVFDIATLVSLSTVARRVPRGYVGHPTAGKGTTYHSRYSQSIEDGTKRWKVDCTIPFDRNQRPTWSQRSRGCLAVWPTGGPGGLTGNSGSPIYYVFIASFVLVWLAQIEKVMHPIRKPPPQWDSTEYPRKPCTQSNT